MKHPLLKSFILAGAVFLAWNCSDSSTVSGIGDYPEYADFIVTGNCHWLPGDVDYLIYEDGTVTDAQGNPVGSFIAENGSILAADGITFIVENIDINILQILNPDIVNEARAQKEQSENGGENPNQPAIESSNQNYDPTLSSANIPAVSSSSTGAVDPNGYPIANYEKLSSGNAKDGWGSRYWDACKPHCSQRDNVDTNATPFVVARNCSLNGDEIPAFTLSPNASQWWTGYEGTKSACEGGNAYACTDMAPVKVNDTLSYAFVATSLSNAQCGQCFQLQFKGGGHNGDKISHKPLAGKTLIVLASNTGGDVEIGQFDIMVPGGGVGMFDALSKQLGVSSSQLGKQYGGLLSTCQEELHDYDLPAESYKSCVKKKCDALFTANKNLYEGCLWFADWFEAADNPTYYYKKVDCPKYLWDKYVSTINTSKDTDLKAGSY
ncbi:MAG: hypothetical protein MJY47_06005 [Fibrobacter sp.]|nr:hypothetical protein [Fibrobacter sp.]